MFKMKDLFSAARDEPIIDTRLRNDIYKFNMQFFAREMGVHNTPVTFGLTNRSPELRLADVIPEEYLREQLDHLKSLMMTPAQSSFLQGMTVEDNGQQKFMFPDPSYAKFMQQQTLSDYSLKVVDGQFDLRFEGNWFGDKNAVSYWEPPAMSIICESYVYWYLKGLLDRNEITESEISGLFTAAYQRVVYQAKLFRDAPNNPTFMQFGLRRQVSSYWSSLVQDVIDEIAPLNFIGVSDTQMAYERGDSDPKGTIAHEAAIIWANLGSNTDDWLRESQFDLVMKWAEVFPQPLQILLPDCYGTKQFFDHAPAEIARNHWGTRIDSMETDKHDPLYRAWLIRHEVDSRTKLVIPSDGQTGEKFIPEHAKFAYQYKAFSAGIGGAWTNNIKGLAGHGFRTPNIVIKPWYANGRPCTKLGDAPNGGKVTGPDCSHNERVRKAFSDEGWSMHQGSLAA